jgi:hypothetical protein
MFDYGVQAFEDAYSKHEWQDVIGGVIAIVGGIQSARMGFPACEAVVGIDFS